MLHQQAWLWNITGGSAFNAFDWKGSPKYHRSKMACCIIRVSSSSSPSMHKVTTNVQRASLGALLGVTGNDGFEREGSQNVVWTRRL